MPGERLLLASIHDVSPRFESEVDRLLDALAPHVGDKLAMLVVPNHWGDSPIVPGSPFSRRLRAWADSGIEMFLHGLVHRDETRHAGAFDRMRARYLTAGEGEFLGLDRTEAIDRINRGRAIIEHSTGRPIAGFVAPAWLYGQGALEALEDCSIPIAEDHLRVWSPEKRRELGRGPVITWASRTPLRLAASLAAAAVLRRAPIRTLRIGVHPPDSRHPALMRSIDAAFRSATRNRRAARYADLLKSPA
jgi:predicted deacetylase